MEVVRKDGRQLEVLEENLLRDREVARGEEDICS